MRLMWKFCDLFNVGWFDRPFLKKFSCQVGSSVKLQCHFGAPGEYMPEWAFGDIALAHGDKYSISQDNTNSMLTIQNASKYKADALL